MQRTRLYDDEEMVDIEGIIAPYDLDNAFQPKSLMIFGDNEEEIRIVQDEMAEELKSFLHHLVRLNGIVRKTRGEQFITVLHYDVIEHS